MTYVIKLSPDTPNDLGVLVNDDKIVAKVSSMAGYSPDTLTASAIVGRLNRTGKRVYVETEPFSLGRMTYGIGFIVERL
jgi:hypothetical protein